jgi:hypothetical protein
MNAVLARNYQPHIKQRREDRCQTHPAGLQGPPLGGGTNPFLVQSLPQIAGEFRENQSQLRRATLFGRSHDLLEANNSYSRISS